MRSLYRSFGVLSATFLLLVVVGALILRPKPKTQEPFTALDLMVELSKINSVEPPQILSIEEVQTFSTPENEAQQQFVNQIFRPALESIVGTFPNEDMRLQLSDLSRDFDEGTTHLVFNLNDAAATTTRCEDGGYLIGVNLEHLMDVFTGCEGELECLEDFVVLMLLHEKYHRDNHFDNVEQSVYEYIKDEADVLELSAKKWIPEMIASGRLRFMKPDDNYSRLLDIAESEDTFPEDVDVWYHLAAMIKGLY